MSLVRFLSVTAALFFVSAAGLQFYFNYQVFSI